MRILNVTAQKPDSTGSGVYLAEMVRCEVAAGHSAAVICGIAPDDPLPFPAGVSAYPVHFETDEVPFPVCGMSDEMPYRATRYRDMDHQMVSCVRAAFAKRIERTSRCSLFAILPIFVKCARTVLSAMSLLKASVL